MFASTGLFENTPCPQGERCVLPYCIFSHEARILPALATLTNARLTTKQSEDDVDAERPLKKRRVDQIRPGLSSRTLSSIDQTLGTSVKAAHSDGSKGLTPVSTQVPISAPERKLPLKSHQPLQAKPSTPVLDTKGSIAASRPTITKPKAPESKKPVIEQLVPRKIASPPAQFPMRMQLVKLLYAEYIRLNKLVEDSSDPTKAALLLTKQEMVTLALDEEEAIAKESPGVYSNVVKLRIKRLRDMKKLEPWKQERKKHIAKSNPELVPAAAPTDTRVQTGLTSKQELALLSHLVTPIAKLEAYGYVPSAPSESDIEHSRQGVEAAGNWEVCNRCSSRFQAFPHRRVSDGALTTNGPCKYHWGRRKRPEKPQVAPGRANPSQQISEDTWTCCGNPVGSEPCVQADTHVYKISDANRLAAVLQFDGLGEIEELDEKTPPEEAVAFDCEMAYTSYGLEMIRLTATNWPEGDELLDVLVRPLGEILDLNSRFSGVWPDDWLGAVPYDENMDVKTEKNDEIASGSTEKEPPPKKRKLASTTSSPSILSAAAATNTTPAKTPLRIVSTPQRARSLLLSHLHPSMPLIGHAIENDLNSARIIHPTIVDTVLLFPASRPLPIRMGLKTLVKKHLGVDIQMGGDRGHDSLEDARATGELLRFKVAQRWKEMKRLGWRWSEEGERDSLLEPRAK